MNREKLNAHNPSVSYYVFQLYVYLVTFVGGFIISIKQYSSFFESVFNIYFATFIVLIYIFTCFWTKKMNLYNNTIEIIYPTRFFCRKINIRYNDISKIVFDNSTKEGNRFLIYLNINRYRYSIISGAHSDIRATIRFFEQKGVKTEFKLRFDDSIERYVDRNI